MKTKTGGGRYPAKDDLIVQQGKTSTLVGLKATPRKPAGKKPRGGEDWLDPVVVEAITRMLIENNEKMFRPPRQAAKLLAYIVTLYHRGEPFPSRAEVSGLLDISIPTIDSAISSRLAEGYLTVEVGTVEGNIGRRPSSLRQRYYIPCNEVLETVEEAKGQRPKP